MEITFKGNAGHTYQGWKNQEVLAVKLKQATAALNSNVSAVLITFNEEHIIEKTLSKLYWCNEIIVVDSGSSDRTLEICKKYNCTIFSRQFEGFGDQKIYAVEKASNKWVLCIDADEILTDELISEIKSELSGNPPFIAYEIPRKLIFIGTEFSFGKESKAAVVRLFDKSKSQWDGALVHERVAVNYGIKRLENKILHYSHESYSDFLKKINLYSTLGAQKLFEKKKRKSWIVILLAIPLNFLKYYILDRNFLNGFKGFTWSLLNTCYHFLKYLKLEELYKNRNSRL